MSHLLKKRNKPHTFSFVFLLPAIFICSRNERSKGKDTG